MSDRLSFQLALDCDNDAFADDPAAEVARILRHVADRLDAGETFDDYQTLLDENGNDVGRARLAHPDSL
jgi:hypothetical protein